MYVESILLTYIDTLAVYLAEEACLDLVRRGTRLTQEMLGARVVGPNVPIYN